MIETKQINEVLKVVTTLTDSSGKSLLMKDSEGNLSASTIGSLLPVRTGNVTGSFANIIKDMGLYLCSAYSESNRFINCVFSLLYVKQDSVTNKSPVKTIDSQGGLTPYVNAFGTVSFAMTGGGTLPTDLRLLYIGVKV